MLPQELKCSISTIKDVRNANHIFCHELKNVPPLDKQHREHRKQFAARMKGPLPFWVAFSDESTFTQDLRTGKVWRRRGEDLPEYYVEIKAHPISCMFWACIAFNYKSEIIPFETSVTSESYIQMLEDNNVLNKLKKNLKPNFAFMQDGAPPHTAKKTKEILEGKVQFISDWPALSPDLNPIEHLWSLVKKMLKGMRFSNRAELIIAVKQAWEKIPMDIINKLVSSWSARLIVCERINGKSLNGHWNEVNREHFNNCPYSFCKTKDWPF